MVLRSPPILIALGAVVACLSASGCAKSPPLKGDAGTVDAGILDVGDPDAGDANRGVPVVSDALGPPVAVALDGGGDGPATDGGGLVVGSDAESLLTSTACNVWSRMTQDAGTDGNGGGGGWSRAFASGLSLGLSVDGLGRVALLSDHQGQVDFGSGPVTDSLGNPCFFLSSFTGDGTHRWSRGISAVKPQVSAWPDGGLAVLLQGTVASLAPDGSLRWVRVLETVLVTDGHSLKAQSDGSLFVVLRSGTVSANPATWKTVYRLSATGEILSRFGFRDDDWGQFVSLSSAGDIFVIHNVTTNNQDLSFNSDFSVAKVDPLGRTMWFKTFATSLTERCSAATATSDGGVVVIGVSGAGIDLGGGPLGSAGPAIAFAASFDGQGRHVASHAFGSPWNVMLLSTRPSGAVLVAGNFWEALTLEGTNVHTAAVGDTDFLVVELGPSLQVARYWHYGNGGGNQKLAGIAVDPDGAMLLAGSFEGKLDLGSGVLRASASALGTGVWTDAFLAKVQP